MFPGLALACGTTEVILTLVVSPDLCSCGTLATLLRPLQLFLEVSRRV